MALIEETPLVSLFNRFAYFSVAMLLSFLLGCPAWAKDCIQKRVTPQAPDDIYKQTNPFPASRENISAGKTLSARSKTLSLFSMP